MLGPVIGGFLDELYGWRGPFMFMLLFGLLAAVIVLIDFSETRLPAGRVRSLEHVPLLRAGQFWALTATASFCSGVFFAFIGGAPYVASAYLGLSPGVHGSYFLLVSAGYIVGNFLTGRLSGTIAPVRLIR
jgi:DHA1 family bicyclomycin/chloramphenicol resistance-like MFS transporter